MRIAWLAVGLLACKKAESPPPRVTPEPPEAKLVPIDAAVPPPPLVDVDLLRAVPTTVRVSSTVANPTILPAHLVDRDLGTAWNSATGKLVGSWIEIEVPDDVELHELRITAGFTARGPKGEDYFTMNPRIRALDIIEVTTPRRVALDVERRDLQRIPLDGRISVRLKIADILPGTKKSWREVSISDLELWGTMPAGWLPPATPYAPFVAVGEEVPTHGCEETDKERDEFLEKTKNVVYDNFHHRYEPECEVLELGETRDLPTPWRSATGFCVNGDAVFGPTDCYVRFTQAGVAVLASVTGDWGEDKGKGSAAISLATRDILPDGADEVIVTITRAALGGYQRSDEWVVVCRAAPTLACSKEVLVASEDWRPTLSFERGAIVLAKGTGDPPPGILGRHPLVFK